MELTKVLLTSSNIFQAFGQNLSVLKVASKTMHGTCQGNFRRLGCNICWKEA